ncbi:MAG: DUF5721 family protein [Defluviitaleaceae bacterium]|nr:DUF5721 family protein [Defluviitaleaceae bacterium]
MLSLSISDVKGFMGKLLKEGIFDSFDLHSLSIQNFACFEIHKIPAEAPPKWHTVRPFAFNLVKGIGATPKSLKIILAIDGNTINIADTSLFLNIHFEEGKITITTGFSQKTFSLDKTAKSVWDNHVKDFLDSNKMEYVNNLE